MQSDQPQNNSSNQDNTPNPFQSSLADGQQHQVPEINLPKGGGALSGIDGKLDVNPVTGSAGLSIPLPVGPARGGFSPSLSISYSSGGGNGLFGMGWQLNLPSIQRKTQRELPEYYNDGPQADTFILAGAEDLIVKLKEANGIWIPEERTQGDYQIQEYRPRIEGSWMCIERWTDTLTGAIHWRTISTNNTITLYGQRSGARVADPADPTKRIFEWLPDYSYDNAGNILVYAYKKEDRVGVTNDLWEQNKEDATNTYLKRVWYGNRTPYFHGDALPLKEDFLFQTVLDYGEHDALHPTPEAALEKKWTARTDAFSNHRPGFEVRTYRRCERVLLFHHFDAPSDQPVADLLVQALTLKYENFADETASNLEGFTYLKSVGVVSYLYDTTTQSYLSDSPPPMDMFYQKHEWNTTVHEVAREEAPSAPVGIQQGGYRWVDYYGEGLSGLLLEGGQAWYYQKNLGGGQLAPATILSQKPSFSGLEQGNLQWQDLDGDGERQLVSYRPPQGFFSFKDGEQWTGLTPFKQLPNRNLGQDPNARWIDLNGDGKADLLVTENDLFYYYPSKGKEGLEPAQIVTQALEEENGPRVVFADPTQSIFLADMTGDGLTDIVRIQNGRVSYWANCGHGHFSKQVIVGDSPTFDHTDQFDPRRLYLFDLDGSGTTDLAYYHSDGLYIWQNQSGNRFNATPHVLAPFPPLHSEARLDLVDFLGQGTSCLVWSSLSAKDYGRPLKYINLTNGKKPHLLYHHKNNLGASTTLEYTTSTEYFLADERAGTPWATKLPFPVHVLQKTIEEDHLQRTRFTRQYSYHHGYYDQTEREFRGFGRVESWDTETANELQASGASNAVAAEHHAVPIKTVSWYHTGAPLHYQRLEEAFAQEYYSGSNVEQDFESTLLPANLSAADYRQAIRACKGLPLRQEVYSLDTLNTDHIHPYSTSQSGYRIKQIQPAQYEEGYACFIAIPVQGMSYGYERNPDDPRISQSLVLATNDLGMPTHTAQVIYPRLSSGMPQGLPWMVQEEQEKLHVITKQVTLTNDVSTNDTYRLRTVWEEQAFEILGLTWTLADGYFSPTALAQDLSNIPQIDYAADYDTSVGGVQRRLSGQSRIKFKSDDLTTVLPDGIQEAMGIPYRTYQLATTTALRAKLLVTDGGNNLLANANLSQAQDSGFIDLDGNGGWWASSGTTIYPSNAPQNFYLPSGVEDALGTTTTVVYDPYQLFTTQVSDALNNVTTAEYDYRMLQPWRMTDINGNQSAVEFDVLGIVVKSAVMGKNGEGDTLADPTAILEYEFEEYLQNGTPNYIHTRVRERHADPNTPWQHSYEYSDGHGNVLLTKVQTTDGDALQWQNQQLNTVSTTDRWIGNGRTILNNKGQAIHQYEPYFSTTKDFEEADALRQIGVTPTLWYDAAGRNIRTDMPDGTFVKTEFDAWQSTSYDAGDTVLDSTWYADALASGEIERIRAANLSANYHATPVHTHLDALGRAIYAEETDGTTTAAVYTRTDLAGRYSFLYDQLATDELIAAGTYTTSRGVSGEGLTDLLGQAIYSYTAVKGAQYAWTDVGGRLLVAWDNPDDLIHSKTITALYDVLHRPLKSYVSVGGATPICLAKTIYGESAPNAFQDNLRGQVYQACDQSGRITTKVVDFKGNPLSMYQQLLVEYKTTVDWDSSPTLETETFQTVGIYDALNRPTLATLPDGSQLRSSYNKGAYVDQIEVRVAGTWHTVMTKQSYDAKGQRQQVNYGNDTLTQFFYDPNNFRLERLLTIHQNQEQLQDVYHTYDVVGNATTIKDKAQSTFFYNNEAISPVKRYTYDARYRLLSATGREHVGTTTPTYQELPHLSNLPHQNIQNAVRNYTQSYTYDKVGNILSMAHNASNNNWTRSYTYNSDARNQLKSTSLPNTSNTPITYQYDLRGNLLKLPHLQVMQWNETEELSTVHLHNGNSAYYRYNGGGQRVRKVVQKDNKRQERLYLGGLERYREYSASNVVQLERWTLVVDDIVQFDTLTVDNGQVVGSPKPTIRYQYRDRLGSSTIEANEQGQVISYEEYYPYGASAYRAAASGVDLSLKRYRFTGKERDEETGLDYFGVRYYASWLGRWTSGDPGGFVDGLNLYRYTRNNPVNGIDREGYNTENVAPPVEKPLPEKPKVQNAPAGLDLSGLKLPSNPENEAVVIIPIPGGQDAYAIYDAGDKVWDYSNTQSITGASASNPDHREPQTIWDYLALPSVWEGMKQMTVWDWGSTILEVAVGFTPLGILYDLYGLYEAVEGGDSKEIGLALLAFVPVGDALKVLKRIQKKGEAALKKGFDKLEEVVNEGFDRLGVPDNRAKTLQLTPANGGPPIKQDDFIQKIEGDGNDGPSFKFPHLKWLKKAKSMDEIRYGCEKVADRAVKDLGEGAQYLDMRPIQFPALGKIRGYGDSGWLSHVAAIKDGRVYDKLTGGAGLPLEEYKELFHDSIINGKRYMTFNIVSKKNNYE